VAENTGSNAEIFFRFHIIIEKVEKQIRIPKGMILSAGLPHYPEFYGFNCTEKPDFLEKSGFL